MRNPPWGPQDDTTDKLIQQEHEEYCLHAAIDISRSVEHAGLAEVNSKLEKHGYKVIRLSDVKPVN